jgi:hypothetical protein
MLVYSTLLWFDCTLNDVVGAVSTWLASAVQESGVFFDLANTTNFEYGRSGHRITSERWDSAHPLMHVVRYAHPDPDVSGRQWITEVGLKQENAEHPVLCTIKVETSDVSAKVDAPIRVEQPRVVRWLLHHCQPSPRTPGCRVLPLDEHTASVVRAQIENRERTHALVLVSPTFTGEYIVSPDELQAQLGGIADVLCIPPHADTYLIEQILMRQYSTYGGALNVVFPPFRAGIEIPTMRLLKEDLEMFWAADENEVTLASYLLAEITHRVNLPNSWRHLKLEDVREHKRHVELQQRREEASRTGQLGDYTVWLETVVNEGHDREKRLCDELEEARMQLEDLEGEKVKLERRLREYETMSHYQRARTAKAGLDEDLRCLLSKCIEGVATPEEILTLLETLYPDRVFILDNAWKSARDSERFQYRKEAFSLLWRLATTYWEILAAGKGDTEARKIFGQEEYASKERDTLSKRGLQLRTFTYKGQALEMQKHLKYGITTGVADTIRIHFVWDAEDRKIVIGHCGRHLDF